MVDDQDEVLVQRADPDALTGLRGQRLSPGDRSAAKLVPVEIARADVEQGGTELILARVAVLLDEPDGFESAQNPVHGPPRELELIGQVGYSPP